MKRLKKFLVSLASIGLLGGILAACALAVPANTQFVPVTSYRHGAYGSGGSGMAGGFIDYMRMINLRDGGINGIKLSWEECDTGYDVSRGVECYERLKIKGDKGASVFNFFSTSITYALIEQATKDRIPIMSLGYGRTDASDGRVFPYIFPLITNYWSQSVAKIKFIGYRSGGMEKFKGKIIVNLYHGSDYGKETISVLDYQADKYKFKVLHIEVPHPGLKQKAQWEQIQSIKPDWVILRGWGVMTHKALEAAAKVKYPMNRIVGSWWSGAEEDVVRAGEAAVGYIAASFSPGGVHFPAIQDIIKHVYKKDLGDLTDKSRLGSVYWNRGVITGIIVTEAIRTAQKRFGYKVLNGEQVRWGLENLEIDDKRLEKLGVEGLLMPLKVSCYDHEGGGLLKFQQWDGKKWHIISDWIKADRSIVAPMVRKSAADYARKKGIIPRTCPKAATRDKECPKKLKPLKLKTDKIHYYMVTSRLKLRAQPNTAYPNVITIMKPNLLVQFLERRGSWLKIKYFDYIKKTTRTGWAFAKYLRSVK